MAILNSKVTAGADYASGRRRNSKRRRKHGLSLIRLFLLPVLLCVVLACRGFDPLFSNHYVPSTRGSALLRNATQASALKSFTTDLVAPEVDSGIELSDGVRAGDMLLIDGTNEKALFSRNAYIRMSLAPATKIMTCLLVLEDSDIHMGDVQTAGPEIAVSEPGASMGGFQQGDKLMAEQVLYCLMVRSGADAANMIAKQVIGSEEAFVKEMNARAKELGATGTHFTNSYGLTDPDHYTMSYGLYLILREAMKYLEFQKLASQRLYTVDYVGAAGQPVQRKWFNTNYYLVGKAKLPEGFPMVTARTETTLVTGACLT